MYMRKKTIISFAAASLFTIPAIGFAMGHGADGHGCGKYKHGKSGHHYSEMSKEQISNGHNVVITQLQSLLDSGSLTEEEAASVKMHIEILQMKSEKEKIGKKVNGARKAVVVTMKKIPRQMKLRQNSKH